MTTVISELNTMPLFEALELLEASNASYVIEDGIIKYVCKESCYAKLAEE